MSRLLVLLLLLLALFALQALYKQLSLVKERTRNPRSEPGTRVIYRSGPDFSHVLREQERAARRAREEAGSPPVGRVPGEAVAEEGAAAATGSAAGRSGPHDGPPGDPAQPGG